MSAVNYDWCGHVAEGADRACGAPIERWSREWRHSRGHELDADHKAIPTPQVGAVDEALALRADRYAGALAASVAADERIAALTELLSMHEFYRSQAESQLSMVSSDPQFGKVWPQTGPEPEYGDVEGAEPDGPHALLCLTTGAVFVRNRWSQDWQRAEQDPQRATHYVWPIPNAGPFIGWHEGYDFDRVLKTARAIEVEFNELHRAMYGAKGYHAEGHGLRPRLRDAYERIRRAEMHRTYEANEKAQAADQKLRMLRRALEDLVPDDTQEWPVSVDDDETVRTVHVVELQRIYDLLAKPALGGDA